MADEFEQQTTLNIPSLIIFGIISVFAIRYLFFSNASPSSTSNSSSRRAQAFPGSSAAGSRRQVPYERIELVASMFPQLSRRDIEWDLVRNGGSVQSTSDKVLRDGRLEAAPPNFRAQPDPSAAAAAATTTTSSTGSRKGQPKPQFQDLITRYGLSDKVAEMALQATGGSEETATQTKDKQKEKGGWSNNKEQRQALLKQRREEMILAARRKMEEKDRAAGKS